MSRADVSSREEGRSEPTGGNGWHEWTDAAGFWQRHTFPEGDDSCWCGTYIPWRTAAVIETES